MNKHLVTVISLLLLFSKCCLKLVHLIRPIGPLTLSTKRVERDEHLVDKFYLAVISNIQTQTTDYQQNTTDYNAA